LHNTQILISAKLVDKFVEIKRIRKETEVLVWSPTDQCIRAHIVQEGSGEDADLWDLLINVVESISASQMTVVGWGT